MTIPDTRRYEMLVRVRNFGQTRSDLLERSSEAREQFAAVEQAVGVLTEQAVRRMSAGAGRPPKTAARAALLERLTTVERTARALAHRTPGLEAVFRLPASESAQALLTAGRLFARNAEAHAEAFVACGMPPTFVADLTAVVDRYEHAIRAHDEERSGRAAAKANIAAALAAGLTAARALDAVLANLAGDDPATMAAWRRDRRIGSWSHAKPAEPAAPSPPEPAPPAQPPA